MTKPLGTTPLGTVEDLGHDADGRPRLRRLGCIADCPRCNAEMELWQDTEEWTENGGEWQHSGYGPCMGVCEACHLLIVDSWDGCKVYELPRKEEPQI
jgi:hypothetical protein